MEKVYFGGKSVQISGLENSREISDIATTIWVTINCKDVI